LEERLPRDRFAVVSNPEFLREGVAIKDFKQPDRVVIGVDDERARAVMAEIYQPIERAGCQMMYTSRRSSEMIKYAANVFLAMKVTFINEIADLCERLDADVMDVSRGVGLDDRIGPKFLNPGPGFGGSCFPKDTLALTKLAIEAKAPIRLVETLVEVNDKRKLAMAAKVIRACGGSVAGKRIAVLGLTYKPKTDDMRDAPSLVIIPELQAAGAQVAAYDPEGVEAARVMLPGVEFADNVYRLSRWPRRGGHHHRMGRVQGPRPGAGQRNAGHADLGRPAQHLFDQDNESARLSVCLRRARVQRRGQSGQLIGPGMRVEEG
jgi:UDPglucose 6-dehydrogenase